MGDHAQGAQRRELLAEIRVSQLEQLLGVDEASELERPEGGQAGAGGKVSTDRGHGGLGQEDLPSVRRAADAGHLVHTEVDVSTVHRGGLTGVQADPNLEVPTGRPSMAGQGLLSLQAPGNGVCRVVEHHEEGVTLGVDLDAPVPAEGVAEQALMGGQQLGIGVAELTEQAGGSLDVGHGEGDDTGRQDFVRSGSGGRGRWCRRAPVGPASRRLTWGQSHLGHLLQRRRGYRPTGAHRRPRRLRRRTDGLNGSVGGVVAVAAEWKGAVPGPVVSARLGHRRGAQVLGT